MTAKLALTVAALAAAAEDACCQGSCPAGQKKYRSLTTSGDKRFCGESCLDEAEFESMSLFEPSLLVSSSETPCADLGYESLVSTEMWAEGPFFRTLDLYNSAAPLVAEPCCSACAEGSAKFWTMRVSTNGREICMERCLRTEDVEVFAVFDSFAKADSSAPCTAAGFTLSSTELHAVGPYFVLSDVFEPEVNSTVVV